MILMVCLDDNNGMMFNHRRQSRDRILREKMLQLTADTTLWMNEFSRRQFGQTEAAQICTDEDFLLRAEPGQVCLVENLPVQPVADQVEKVVVFRWNRTYPADQWLDLDLTQQPWQLFYQEEFAGSSHEKITMEVYTR